MMPCTTDKGMNWLDIVIVVVLLIAAFDGLRRGIIGAVLSLAGLVVGILLAVRYYVPFSERLSFMPSETLARIVAFVIILVGILAIARLIAWLLGKIASALMIGWLNRLGGAAFGVALGAVLISAVLGLWITYAGTGDVIAQSRLATLLLQYFPMVRSLLPAPGLPPL